MLNSRQGPSLETVARTGALAANVGVMNMIESGGWLSERSLAGRANKDVCSLLVSES